MTIDDMGITWTNCDRLVHGDLVAESFLSSGEFVLVDRDTMSISVFFDNASVDHKVNHQGTNISPKKSAFWVDDFPFPKVGYVNFLEGNHHWSF